MIHRLAADTSTALEEGQQGSLLGCCQLLFKPAVHQNAKVIVKPAKTPHSIIFFNFVFINLFLSLPILVFTLMKRDPSIPPNTPKTRAP